jgi:cupin fold WbuC family metalloprotein
MKNSTKNEFVKLSKSCFGDLTEKAKNSERKRHLVRLHTTDEAKLHSMINVFTKGSYVQPHRHWVKDEAGELTTKGESFIALKGKGRIIQFDDDGNVIDLVDLDASQQDMLWIPENCWHTVLALSPVFIVFENKTGPWDAETDKAFHSSFPSENANNLEKYVEEWEKYSL